MCLLAHSNTCPRPFVLERGRQSRQSSATGCAGPSSSSRHEYTGSALLTDTCTGRLVLRKYKVNHLLQQTHHNFYSLALGLDAEKICTNSLGIREAPPTNAPSTSDMLSSSWALEPLTDPEQDDGKDQGHASGKVTVRMRARPDEEYVHSEGEGAHHHK